MNLADALDQVRLLFIDTAPIIYHVEGHATYQPLTDVVFQKLAQGELQAATSPVTLAECLVHPYRSGDSVLIQQFRNVITRGTNTRYVGVDVVAEQASELRARHNLTLTDAFQVAAALASGCDAFLTNDTGLKRLPSLSVLVLDDFLS